jgi:hypothetical protein
MNLRVDIGGVGRNYTLQADTRQVFYHFSRRDRALSLHLLDSLDDDRYKYHYCVQRKPKKSNVSDAGYRRHLEERKCTLAAMKLPEGVSA